MGEASGDLEEMRRGARPRWREPLVADHSRAILRLASMKPTTGFLVQVLSVVACVSCMSRQAVKSADVVVRIDAHMDPPRWATLERQLLADNVPASREFFNKYFDHRGYLQVFVRWGANDGPDDAFEN